MKNNMNAVLENTEIFVNIKMGKAKLSLQQICEIEPGYVITLDKFAGEPLDLYVNNNHIAKCEAVAIDENFGVRITEIVNAS